MSTISPETTIRCLYQAMSTLAAIGVRYPIANEDWKTAHTALSRIAAQLEHIESQSIQCPQHDYTPNSKG